MTGTVAGTFHPPALEEEIAAMPGWRRVRFLGQVPRTEIVHAMDRARAGLVLNHPTVNYVDAYSTKMFEYMARGLPVVCSNFPLWVDIVGGADCGIAVDPREPAGDRRRDPLAERRPRTRPPAGRERQARDRRSDTTGRRS